MGSLGPGDPGRCSSNGPVAGNGIQLVMVTGGDGLCTQNANSFMFLAPQRRESTPYPNFLQPDSSV